MVQPLNLFQNLLVYQSKSRRDYSKHKNQHLTDSIKIHLNKSPRIIRGLLYFCNIKQDIP